MWRIIVLCLIISIFCLLSYNINSLDLLFAQLPYNFTTKVFYGESHKWCWVIYYSVPVIVCVTILINFLIILSPSSIFYKHQFQYRKKQSLIVLLILLIGPGIIVNTFFKKNWGRPRPYQVLRDSATYRAFYQPNFGASGDNSFPSGHASIGFFLGTPILAINRRKFGILISILFGTIIGIVRILQGGHFFSDVLFAGIIVWFVAELVHYLLKNKTYSN